MINKTKKLYSLLLCICIAACSPKRNPDDVVITRETAPDENLPDIEFTTLDGRKLQAKTLQGHPSVLVLFQPDCDHCQREAREIKKHIKAFENYQLYFVSTNPAQEVNRFMVDYKFSGEQNVFFVLTDLQSILDTFGPVSTPSLYIYSASGALVRKFNGETDINLILKEL